MAFKQPKVPEYRQSEGVETYIKALILFLKDFCQETWIASGQAQKGLKGISYPVTSVFSRTGDVALQLNDLNQVQRGKWSGNTQPKDIPDGITYVDGGAKGSTGFPVDYVVCLAVKVSVYRTMQILVEKTNANLYIRSATDGSTWGSWKRHMAAMEIYPVGAIYLSVSSISPASLFGGTWEQIKDRFLLAAGSSYTAGATGGAATVSITPKGTNAGTAITAAQMPKHRHVIRLWNNAGTQGTAQTVNNYGAGTTAATYGARGNYGTWQNASFNCAQNGMGDQSGITDIAGNNATHTHMFTGTAQSINKMPPYLAVYVWKRVS